MLIKAKKSWEMPERRATSETAFLNRRQILAGIATTAASGAFASTPAFSQRASDDPSIALYPVKTNETYKLDRPVTLEKAAANYNNFYEFGTSKSIVSAAQSLKIRPWTLKIDGLVDAPKEFGIDELLKLMPLEERLYRHRCVEAWSMAVPWSGFPLRALLDAVKPLSSAKFVRFETFLDKSMAPGQRQSLYPWPYIEALTIEEAAHDLSFLATGVYGKPLAKQFGAPLRLALPWKYGFKSIKSITKITLTDKRPVSLWEAIGPSEYGFWANVNPKVDHPRWSQATERVLDTGEQVPTLLFNGYASEVAGLYKGLESEKLWM